MTAWPINTREENQNVKTKFIEVDDKANWAKLHLSQWEPSDLERKSKVREDTPLLVAVEGQRRESKDPLKAVFIRDLQTEEGATLYPQKGIDPKPQLDAHRVWCCPLFLPFCYWLFHNYDGDVTRLPDLVELPDNDVPLLQGYRRPGEDMFPLANIRDKMVAALREAKKLPEGVVEMAIFQKAAVTSEEWHLFCVWRDAQEKQDYNRWLGSMMAESGRYGAIPVPGQVMLVPMDQRTALLTRLGLK